MKNVLFWAILAAGILVRVIALDRYPLPAHQDEVVSTITAYSIAETHADLTGAKYPFVIRGLGESDYRPALYAWLSSIPMRFSGFSVTTARVPSVVLGICSLLLVFSFASRLGGEKFGLVSLLFASLMPWHITFSRLAHEGAILSAFFVIAVFWLWQRAAASAYPPVLTALVGALLGFSTNAYQSTRLIAPLLALIIGYDIVRTKRPVLVPLALLAAGSLLAALPQIIVLLTDPNHFFSRAASTFVEGRGPFGVAGEVIWNFYRAFEPGHLFWPSMRDSGLTSARLLPVEIVCFYSGFWCLAKLQLNETPRFRTYIYFGLIVSMLPAVLTTAPHSIRMSAALNFFPLFSAAGWVYLERMVTPRWKRTFQVAALTSVVGSFAFVAFMYLASDKAPGQRSNNALVQVGEKLSVLRHRYESVFMTVDGSHTDLYAIAFSGFTPQELQSLPRNVENRNGWDFARRFGDYHFLGEADLAMRSQESGPQDLFISRQRLPGIQAFDSVAWFDDRYYFSSRRPPEGL